eukprot:CAMPEP_0114318464 /NCGR_PEP_ID=MMETSP0059-20121206/24634_1 /TAXON_ID=36894 /ORGANISM="Pyramimonas parkeae, Strain CCMP726" /LENGTH=113 /DNA_ID=CAMNT_0001445231 /DNA_START=219 /DNA_END=556 /DNA_ORIENTATION=+
MAPLSHHTVETPIRVRYPRTAIRQPTKTSACTTSSSTANTAQSTHELLEAILGSENLRAVESHSPAIFKFSADQLRMSFDAILGMMGSKHVAREMVLEEPYVLSVPPLRAREA